MQIYKSSPIRQLYFCEDFVKISLGTWCPEKLPPTLGIGDDGALDAGLARNVKPHIDLKMKLHKKLKKERPARTEAE